jgi:hypothetical protein
MCTFGKGFPWSSTRCALDLQTFRYGASRILPSVHADISKYLSLFVGAFVLMFETVGLDLRLLISLGAFLGVPSGGVL